MTNSSDNKVNYKRFLVKKCFIKNENAILKHSTFLPIFNFKLFYSEIKSYLNNFSPNLLKIRMLSNITNIIPNSNKQTDVGL